MGRFRAVADWVWHESERQTLRRWCAPGALALARERAQRIWLPRARAAIEASGSTRILELYPGVISLGARLIDERRVTIIEPLMDDFRRRFPGEMPEKAQVIRQPIEAAVLPSNRFDVAIAIDALDRAQNPQIALVELFRALAPGGLLLIGTQTFPRWLVLAHLALLRIAPRLAVRQRLYRFTMPALRRAIARRFWITTSERVAQERLCERWWFVAEKPDEEGADV